MVLKSSGCRTVACNLKLNVRGLFTYHHLTGFGSVGSFRDVVIGARLQLAGIPHILAFWLDELYLVHHFAGGIVYLQYSLSLFI